MDKENFKSYDTNNDDKLDRDEIKKWVMPDSEVSSKNLLNKANLIVRPVFTPIPLMLNFVQLICFCQIVLPIMFHISVYVRFIPRNHIIIIKIIIA